MSKWFEFNQRNSGGRFYKEMGLMVFVQAATAEEANARAEVFGVYFDGVRSGSDCPCCGDRWSPAWGSDEGLTTLEMRARLPEAKKFADGFGLPLMFAPYGATELVSYDTATTTFLA